MKIEAHMTPGGRVAVTATDEHGSLRKYVTGGYRHYLVRALRGVRTGEVFLSVVKRTNSTKVAHREMRLRGDEHTVMLTRADEIEALGNSFLVTPNRAMAS